MTFPLKLVGILKSSRKIITLTVGHTSAWTATLSLASDKDDLTVDWGDGSGIESITQVTNKTHNYAAGDYTINIYTYSTKITRFLAVSSRVKSVDFSKILVETTNEFRVNSNPLLNTLVFGNYTNKINGNFFAYSCAWTILDFSKVIFNSPSGSFFWVGTSSLLTQIILKNANNVFGGNVFINSNTLFVNGLNTLFASFNDSVAYDVSNDNLTATAINRDLVMLDNDGAINGTFTGDGSNAAPDGSSGGFDGLTAKTNLQGKGWTVTTN